MIGSDSCEVFFSKIGSMQGMERAFDFQEQVNCVVTISYLAYSIEHMEIGAIWEGAYCIVKCRMCGLKYIHWRGLRQSHIYLTSI